jgi:integrase
MNTFGNSVANVRLSEATTEFIERFLDGRKVRQSTKHNDKRALSRFFSWCIERPRRWITANPCREIRIQLGEQKPPAVLSLAECRSLLGAAEKHAGGVLAPYVAVCLFGGLRPTEAQRLNWTQVNLDDGEIRIDSTQSKTKRGRIVKICPTLRAWLKAYEGKPFNPPNRGVEFQGVKRSAGFKSWTPDVLRHTAISHYFRKSGSYGFTAEQFGNSEAIIKNHYQGRVSSEDTKAFYQITPGKGGAK